MKKSRSLMSQYSLLIVAALLFWPVVPALFYAPAYVLKNHHVYSEETLRSSFLEVTASAQGMDSTHVTEILQNLRDRFPEGQLYWVDPEGYTHFIGGTVHDVPIHWSYNDLVALIDLDQENSTFTIKSTITLDNGQGFAVFTIPKRYVLPSDLSLSRNSLLVALFVLAGLVFLMISLVFFMRIRKRLVRLQHAMVKPDQGIPAQVSIQTDDEIGRLEEAFNQMIDQLEQSRQKEKEEEQLRKELISNLSHDLRTPLTIIRQNMHTIQEQPDTIEAKAASDHIIRKLNDLDQLIEHLMSYTLISAGKYPIHLERIDIIEETRFAIAEWYPIFEREDFLMEIDLPEAAMLWHIDRLWFRRILDNLFQNVLRHAAMGRYIGIRVSQRKDACWLIVEDKGLGMSHDSSHKGAGLGLSIVSLMAEQMNLQHEVISSPQGTIVCFSQAKN